MAYKEISTLSELEEEVVKSDKPVIVDFWAPWCGPCKMLTPVFESLASEMDTVKFVKVNIDDAEEITDKFSIMSVPTLIVVKDGKVLAQKAGAMTKDQLKGFLSDSIAGN